MSGPNAGSKRLLDLFPNGDAWLVAGRYDANDDLVPFAEGPAGSFDLPDDADLYYCVGSCGPAGRTDIKRVYALVIDDVGNGIDRNAFEMLFPLAQYVWVESSAGSFHVVVKIIGGMDKDAFKALRLAMRSHWLWGSAHNTGAAALYRLPQGIHSKSIRGGRKVTADRWQDVGHTPEEIWKALGGGAPKTLGKGSRFDLVETEQLLGDLVAMIPNPVADWDLMANVGRAVWGASEGLWPEPFFAWAGTFAGNDPAITQGRWDSYHDAQIGRFWLLRLARSADPAGVEAWLKREAAAVFSDVGADAGPLPVAGGGSPAAAKQLRYAQAILRNYGGVIRFNVDRGAWAVFGGGRWEMLEPGVKRAYQISVNMAALAGPRDKGDADITAAAFHDGVEGLCRQWPTLQVRERDFDVDPWLLGTPDGTVDLRTGVLRAAVASDMISKITAVGPSETAACPRWLRFIDEVSMKDGESEAFLQQYAGYCLTGVTKEEMFLFLHGPGKNGKSKFADTLMGVWGDYAVKPVGDLFVKKAHGMGHTSKLAMLAGARLCTISEVPASAAWDEVLLKDVTGGGKITAGFKHKNEFSFEPAFKLLAYGNHQPTFPGGIDESVRRRFWMMEFRFIPAPPDTGLMDKLRKEWPGILRWAIDGCLDWQRAGLMKPRVVEQATEGFFDEQDLLGRWLKERVEVSRGSIVQATDLFKDWIEWRNREGNHTDLDTQTAFGKEVSSPRRGLKKGRGSSARGYQDVRLRSKAATTFDEN